MDHSRAHARIRAAGSIALDSVFNDQLLSFEDLTDFSKYGFDISFRKSNLPDAMQIREFLQPGFVLASFYLSFLLVLSLPPKMEHPEPVAVHLSRQHLLYRVERAR